MLDWELTYVNKCRCKRAVLIILTYIIPLLEDKKKSYIFIHHHAHAMEVVKKVNETIIQNKTKVMAFRNQQYVPKRQRSIKVVNIFHHRDDLVYTIKKHFFYQMDILMQHAYKPAQYPDGC